MSIEATLTLNWWGDQNFKRLRERGAAVEIVSLRRSRLRKRLSIYPFLDRRDAERAVIQVLTEYVIDNHQCLVRGPLHSSQTRQ